MTIKKYLHLLRVRKQKLCLDRLTIFALVVSNALLVTACLSRKPAVELALPFVPMQVGIQHSEVAEPLLEWWGLSLAELLGNLNIQNMSFVETRIQQLFSPALYQQVQETLDQQFRRLRDDRVSLTFEPLSLEFDRNTQAVRVTGNSVAVSGNQRLKGEKAFTFHFQMIRYRPVLTAIQIESSLQ